MMKKMKKWFRIYAVILITTKSQPLLEGHLLPVPAKFGRRPFPRSSVSYPVYRMTERMTERQTERSHNVRLSGGGFNNAT